MSHFISFSGSSLAAGTTSIDFRTGRITFSDGTYGMLSGNASEVKSLTLNTSQACTVYLFGEEDSLIDLVASKYTNLSNIIITNLKIKCSSSYNLYLLASTTETGISIT